ncbi:MAG: DUF2779 domain-containing protein [Gemmatimonadota bacterium]|nr:DUF2779 domain-containing protein [Gemmatimonadota bacterium]
MTSPDPLRRSSPTHLLSKTTYMRGHQCTKALSLYTHHRELLPPVSPSQQAVFDAGSEVGLLAQQLFPGGIDARPDSARDFTQSLAKTAQAIAQGAPVIYEAAFVYDDVLVAVDLLRRDGTGWRAYEVKGTGSVKPQHIDDAALQYYVMTSAGLAVRDISIVHLNMRYVRAGALEVPRLFTISSVHSRVQPLLPDVPARVAELKSIVRIDTEPVVEIGNQCTVPYACGFMAHCWRDVPAATRGPRHVEQAPLRAFVDGLQYPLSFMDFETCGPSVPMFEGTSPFNNVPFQFSVHGQDERGGPTSHTEFLADGTGDPREAFVEALLRALPPRGDILVYYQPFEVSRLRELAVAFPQHADALQAIINRCKDLNEPFKRGWYYDPAMGMSTSIKVVLPALVPELSYEGMPVPDGATASRLFQLVLQGRYEGDLATLRRDLLAYCALDTWAMVKILHVLDVAAHTS